MGVTTLIWDHNRVALWRAGRQGSVILAEGVASNIDAVVDFLELHADATSITRLRIYVDLPELDHNLERIPRIGSKLQKQLLEQRIKKHYGNELRAWSAISMLLERLVINFFRVMPQGSCYHCRDGRSQRVFEGITAYGHCLLPVEEHTQAGERIGIWL